MTDAGRDLRLTALRVLSRNGGWMRLAKVGVPRSVLLCLVASGHVRRNDRKRYRITGAGFEALDKDAR